MDKNEYDIKIEKYKNSFNSNYFKDIISPDKINGFENSMYYLPVINSWYDQRFNELIENDNLKDEVHLLTSYLNDLVLLMTNTVELYIFIDRYDFTNKGIINRINKKESDVLSVLKLIKNYKISINLNNEKGFTDLSNNIKNYCLYKFEECIEIIEDKFLINIYESPLNTSFKEVINIFNNEVGIIHDNSINISYKDIKNTFKSEKNIKGNSNTKKNPYPDHFKKENTFVSFKKYVKLHIIEPHLDYSYLFQRLLEDNLIHKMGHKSFMNWLIANKFIKPQTYQKLIEKNQFYSLSKSESNTRMNNFNNVFNI